VTIAMASIFGIYLGVSITSQKTIVSKLASENLRGTAFGIYYLFIGVSFLIANAVFGLLLENFGTQQAYGYSMGMCSVAIVMLFVVSRQKLSKAELQS
jgi:MFS family permease